MFWILAIDSDQAMIFKVNRHTPYVVFLKAIQTQQFECQKDQLFTFFRNPPLGLGKGSTSDSSLDENEKIFCKTIARILNQSQKRGKFEFLVIFAKAKLLNYVQQNLSLAAASAIKGTNTNDFHQHSFAEFEREALAQVNYHFQHQSIGAFY